MATLVVSISGPRHKEGLRFTNPTTALITTRTRNRQNTIWAMPADAEAMPPNPNTPAINAITKNAKAILSMTVSTIKSDKNEKRRLGGIAAYLISRHFS